MERSLSYVTSNFEYGQGGEMSGSGSNHEALAVVPTDAAVPEVGRYLWMMEDMRAKTKRSLVGIAPAALDWAPLPATNTIGTLLYHIAAVEAGWYYIDVLQQTIPADLSSHLPYNSWDEHGHLTVVANRSLTEHLATLDVVRARLLAGFGAMSLDDFYRLRPSDDAEVTPEWCLYHLIEHEATHRGELEMVRQLAEATLADRTA